MYNRPTDRFRRMLVRRLLARATIGAAGVCGALSPVAAWSQAAPVISQPVVQAIPGGESMKLNTALGRLAADPRNVEALMDAGNASIAVGDVEAAVGFFQRAAQLSPRNGRITAGLAGAYAVAGDPVAALPLFEEGERLGRLDASALSARGLAFDLVGDNATAQTYYREAMALDPSDETVRRLGLSLAMSGDRKGMETVLSPLLQKYDMAAWRARSFGFAILGVPDEAESIARQVMPPETASAMGAYLRFMPRLTRAQQAAAANLGQFPRAAEIGRDDPRFAALVRTRPAKAGPQLAAVAPATDRRSRSQRRKDEERQAREAAARLAQAAKTKTAPASLPQPAQPAAVSLATAQPRETTPATPVRTAPSVAEPVRSPPQAATLTMAAPVPARTPTPTPAPVPSPTPAPVSAPKPAPAQPVPAPAVAQPAPAVPAAAPVASPAKAATSSTPGFASLDGQAAPGFDLRQAAGTASAPAPSVAAPAIAPPAATAPATPVVPVAAPPLAAAPSPSSATAADPTARRSLDELFADLSPPSREVEVASGAVDVRKLPVPKKVDPAVEKAAREKAEAEAKAKAEKAAAAKQPSRIWVQLATGRDKKALAFDFRRFSREDPDAFKGRKGFTSAFGVSTRLITGPFANEGAANAFLNQIRKAGRSGAYLWTSPAGQVVDPLPGG